MPTDRESDTQEDRGREFLAGELIGRIARGVWAAISGLVAAVSE